jgi:hypothetical protein
MAVLIKYFLNKIRRKRIIYLSTYHKKKLNIHMLQLRGGQIYANQFCLQVLL